MMDDRDITRGTWVTIENEKQFYDCLIYGCPKPQKKCIQSDFSKGEYQGPGQYRLLYYQNNNRVCFELMTPDQLKTEINALKLLFDTIWRKGGICSKSEKEKS